MRAAAAVLVVAVVAAGCGTSAEPGPSGAGDDRIDTDRMYEVAEDEGASAAEVVTAGSAVDAARSGDTVLVTYTVHNSDDEGRSAGAWRLYDAAGEPVAEELAGVTEEGHATPRVIGVPDGYYVRDEGGRAWHVDQDGVRTRVRRAAPGPAAPGDVPLDDGSTRVYRPADRTVVPVAPRPTGDVQGWAVTADGTEWMQGGGRVGVREIPFRRSADGGPWVDVAAFPLDGPRQYVASSTLTGVGEHVVAPVITESRDRLRGSVDALLVRSTDDPAGRPWTEVDLGELPGDGWWDARVLAVDETTVALGPWGGPFFLVDLTEPDAAPRPVDLPTGEDSWSVEAEDGRLYATHFDHADAWTSDDRGASWERLPH